MKISKRNVDAAEIKDKDYFIWDAEMKGFGLRVFASGKKSYLIQYRAEGRTRRRTLGAHGVLTPDNARKLAGEFLSDVAFGGNPSEDKKNSSASESISGVCDRFMNEHVNVHLKAASQRQYNIAIEKHIKPYLGTYRTEAVKRADVAKFNHYMKDTPTQANRVMAVLSKMMTECEVWGLRPDGSNPCRHVKKYKENKRERYLNDEEIARLGDVLDQCRDEAIETLYVVAAYRLLALTGARLSEIQTLKWDYVEDGCFNLPDSKTGTKRVYFGEAVQVILNGLPRTENNPYVLAGTKEGQHLNDLQKPWRRIRKRAGLEDVRIHDLRHTFASQMLSAGHSLPIIGKLLGHAEPRTTARYAHLADGAMRDVAASMSSSIGNRLDSNK